MLETSTIRDPLVLHFAFAKRQPFVVARFLDTSEFAALKDFVPHLAVHESLDKMESGKQDSFFVILFVALLAFLVPLLILAVIGFGRSCSGTGILHLVQVSSRQLICDYVRGRDLRQRLGYVVFLEIF